MNYAYKQKVGSPTRKSVLVALANLADQEGCCFPSVQYISDRTELSRRAVQTNLSRLVTDGYVNIKVRIGKRGQRSNVYVIDCGGVQQVRRGAQELQEGAHITAKGGAPAAPITVFNNHIINIGAESEVTDWMQVRKLKKAPWTNRVAKRVLAGLLKLSNSDPETQRLIIAQSADNGWTDIFPLRKKVTANSKEEKVPNTVPEIQKMVTELGIDLPDNCNKWDARKAISDQTGISL